MPTELKFIQSITWEKVFALWEKEEASLPHWIAHYEQRGFASWREWRKSSVRDLCPEQLDWSLCRVADPVNTVPEFHAGPFRAWMQKYYGGLRTIPFRALAENTEIQSNPNINEIMGNFPATSTIIGVRVGDDIVIIEGMHRCAALAVARSRNMTINTELFIACAEFTGELPLFGQENSPT